VLETLDAIDWSKINHSYGPATDLPTQIRALAFGNKEEQEEALWELHGNIWHQGTVYEATAQTVPFLLEMVREKHPGSADILALLALTANGTSYLEVHGKRAQMSESDHKAQIARELRWVEEARAAVAKGADLYWELAGTAAGKLRDLSIYLLGILAAQNNVVQVIDRILGDQDVENPF
jgi:hypothetical protein